MTISKVFISHTESDSEWVEHQMIPALTDAGLECHHEALFSLGKPRLLEFEEAIKQADRILLICSPAYFADESLRVVELLADRHGEKTKSWPVIPIIRHAVNLPPRLDILNTLGATDEADWPEALNRLCRNLKVDPPSKPEKPNCPYPGMNPFEEDGDYPFYGRRTEVREILERLRLHPFLAVIGASGSGKSSLVHAGLLPELESSTLFGDGSWLFSSFRPSQRQKDQSLVSQLSSHLGGNLDDLDSAAATVTSLLQSVSDNGQADAARLLLVIDQFEEVYTLQNERDEELQLTRQDADEFQETLLRLAEVAQCYVVLTVRADFFGELIESPIWEKGVKNHRYELTTLGAQGMRQAIVQPALDQKVCIDQALVERLLAETGSEPGILPFLQETLVLLWEKLQWRYLSVLDYESLVKGRIHEFGSGLEVAMAQRADAAINALPSANHHQVARRILLRLVQFGEGRSHTRRQQTVAQLSSTHSDPETFKTTLQHLTEKRLLTIGDPRAGQDASLAGKEQDERPNKFQDDHRVLDVAHDKLITGWPALGKWIHERQNAEETRRWLESKTKEWIALGRRRFGGALLDKVELAQCDKWLGTADAHDLGIPFDLGTLRRHSIQRIWVRRATVIALLLSVVSLIGTGLWGVRKTKEERRQRRELAASSFAAIADSLSASFRVLRSEGLLDNPELNSYRKKLLEETTSQLDGIAEKVGDDSTALESVGEAYIGLAWDTYEQGAQVEAIELYDHAILVFKQLQELNPDNIEYQLKEAFCYNNQGWSYDILGDDKNLDIVQDKALAIRLSLHNTEPSNPEVVRQLAVSYGNISTKLYDRNEREAAYETSTKAIKAYRNLISQEKKNGWHRLNLSHELNTQGKWKWIECRWDESMTLRQESLELRKELIDDYDSDSSGLAKEVYEYWYARSLSESGQARARLGNTLDSVVLLEQSRLLLSDLLNRHPDNNRARLELGITCVSLAQNFHDLQKFEKSAKEFLAALSHFGSLASGDSRTKGILIAQYNAKVRFAEFLTSTGSLEEANELFREVEKEVSNHSEIKSEELHAKLRAALGRWCLAVGDTEKAVDHLNVAFDTYAKTIKNNTYVDCDDSLAILSTGISLHDALKTTDSRGANDVMATMRETIIKLEQQCDLREDIKQIKASINSSD